MVDFVIQEKSDMHHLPERLGPILKEVLSKHHPEWLYIIRDEVPLAFTSEQRFALQQACGDELSATGLMEDDEPNERGYRLEELIDWLGKS